MTMNKRPKSVKYRGSKTHGCGSMKKRRGAGHRGGRGAAGSGKRADSKKPTIWSGKYFGKSGFTSKSRTKTAIPITLRMLDQLSESFVAKKLATKEGDVISVDLVKAGYTKLLGSGQVRSKFKVSVPSASSSAVEKIKKAGGDVVQDSAAPAPESSS